MSCSAPGAPGAIVISLDDFRKKSAPRPAEPKAERADHEPRPSINLLTELNTFEMVSLQRNHLDESKMIFRDKTALWKHFNEVGGTAFGAFKNKELISMILMAETSDLPNAVQKSLPDPERAKRHAIISGVLVNPAFKGMGISQDMINACVANARITHIDHLYARVRTGNEASLKSFQKVGFEILPFAEQSSDASEHAVYYLHLNLSAERQAEKVAEPKALSNIRDLHIN